MRLSEGVEQAIQSVAILARVSVGIAVPAPILGDILDVSKSYLVKHLQALSSAGILNGSTGTYGGYWLAKPAGEITLLDIVLAIEGSDPAFRSICCQVHQRNQDAFSACVNPDLLAAAMLVAEQAYKAALGTVSIGHLLDQTACTDGHDVTTIGVFCEEIVHRIRTRRAGRN